MCRAWLVLFAWMLTVGRGSARLLEEDCGVAVQAIPKIVGGVDAGELKNPWMALIKTEDKFICGGSLINTKFVLTAAHCICNDRDCIIKSTQLTVTLGVYHLLATSESDYSHETYNVERVYLHDSFEIKTHSNDIALLRLQRSVVYKPQIKPICILLNAQHKPQTDAIQQFTAVGWGQTDSGKSSNKLQMVQIDKIDRQTCKTSYWYDSDDTKFCAGTSDGKDTCGGDSGGPLYTQMFFDDIKRVTQLGIVSSGSTYCRVFGVYTNVMAHIDFIERVVLDADIEVVLPHIDLLDAGCLGDGRFHSWDRRGPDAIRSFEWLAEVYMDSFMISYGALISKTFVVTTAQLIPESTALKVELGQGDEHTYAVASVHKHPEFVSRGQNDIALLELGQKVQYTESIRPICLPSPSNEAEQQKFRKRAADPGQNLIAIGWGTLTNVAVRRTNASECYQEDHQEIVEQQLCIESPAPHLLRVGSGSPLVNPLTNGNRKVFSLVGLASFGRIEPFAPNVYTNVLEHLEWIGKLVKA
ncbi:serine protease 53 [Drosophila mauritiana]|uniref:Serine protease 53 n=1 Tax=Drosophila mauritiana TaxID=7226 RepID=A0A6P8JZ07_DROMA|nr:serine protease 53 [Drosophila mauritiana]XP_033155366.1 serine protease 53 [Drosophila mauritiana]XP_033155367.1 serine protease 53 [Drosophila mauritiana]